VEAIGLDWRSAIPSENVTHEYVEKVLSKELFMYSNQIIRKSKLNRIVLCKNLATMGDRAAGLTDAHWISRLGLKKNTICLDVEQSGLFARMLVHHEIFHMIDYYDDLARWSDPDWCKLNEKAFKYGKRSPCERSKISGLITDYAMSNVYEDKAEVYAHMIIDYRGTESRAEKDPILKSKVLRMKELLKRFSNLYDDNFWSDRKAASTPAKGQISKERLAEVVLKKWGLTL